MTQREPIKALEITEAQRTSTKMLLALSRTGKHVYEGTVPSGAVKARRRAKNKAARIARRAAR